MCFVTELYRFLDPLTTRLRACNLYTGRMTIVVPVYLKGHEAWQAGHNEENWRYYVPSRVYQCTF